MKTYKLKIQHKTYIINKLQIKLAHYKQSHFSKPHRFFKFCNFKYNEILWSSNQNI